MIAPVRLRLSRAKGFNLQAHSHAVNGLAAVAVARRPASIFGNPFVVGRDGDRADCVGWFAHMLNGLIMVTASPLPIEQMLAQAAITGNIRRLTGRNLACWCALDGKPCHADILIEIANDPAKVLACDEIAGRNNP